MEGQLIGMKRADAPASLCPNNLSKSAWLPPFHPVFMFVETPARNCMESVELCCSRMLKRPCATFKADSSG
jgi:hypothetical protein